MIIKAGEKGQALILITLAAVGLFAFAALAIDGSMAYSNKRHAQNAADTAALAGALVYARQGKTENIEAVALARAETNGYENVPGDTSTVVTVTVSDVPDGEDCPGEATGKDITVTIVSYLDTTFSKVIGRNTIASGATATSRACGFKLVPLFDGNAIVALNESIDFKNCPFDSGESNAAHWKIEGGGIFSNGCASAKDLDAVEFVDAEHCVASVGTAGVFDCTPQATQPIKYPEGVDAIMPPNPCDGTAGDIGITPSSGQTTFKNGVYCISNMDAFDKKDVVLDNATLYVTDTKFSLKFAGDGGFYGKPTEMGGYTGSEPYANYYMIIVRNAAPCTDFTKGDQVLEWRGNGSGSFYGTILAPSACLDLRGNGDSDGMHTQIIGYTVSSNGNAGAKDEVYINYKEDENHQVLISPSISILE